MSLQITDSSVIQSANPLGENNVRLKIERDPSPVQLFCCGHALPVPDHSFHPIRLHELRR
jgi:hypothetical protein